MKPAPILEQLTLCGGSLIYSGDRSMWRQNLSTYLNETLRICT